MPRSLLRFWSLHRGDLDGFLALSLNNLITLLLAVGLCRSVLGYSDMLLFSTIIPASGVSLLLGNFAYARSARRLSRQESRQDCTALPYGINTVTLLAYIFLVMLPVKLGALSAGLSEAEAVEASWKAGTMACLGSGCIEVSGALVAQQLRRWLPRASLLSTLAGIALGYISLGFLLRSYAYPVVGLPTLAIICLGYFGRVRWPLPTGLMAVLLGIGLGWISGLMPQDPIAWERGLGLVALHLPVLQLSALWDARMDLFPWLGVIIPMGLFNVVGSLQNLESAEAAGDRYPTGNSLLVNGLGTVVAAAFGSCFPTTIYIGHPGFKAMGARAGYSSLNGVVMAAICLLGGLGVLALLVPIEAGMAILLFIGLSMTAQAFQSTPRKHAPAVALGMLPGLAGWGAMLLKAGLRTGDVGTVDAPFGEALIGELAGSDIWAKGLFALEQGQIITAMLLAAWLVYLIEGRFRAAATCSGIAAALSWFGILHGWTFSTGDTVVQLGWGAGAPWALAYGLVTLTTVAARPFHDQSAKT